MAIYPNGWGVDSEQGTNDKQMENVLSSLLDLFNHHDKKLATAASLLLIMLMSLFVAEGVLFGIEHMGVSKQAANGIASKKVANTKERRFNISDLNIFGETQTRIVQEAPKDVPETKLNLELQGIFATEDPIGARAVVASKGKSGELFKIGDRLPGNAVLEAVFETYILIKRGSRIEKLQFSESSLNGLLSQPKNQSAAAKFVASQGGKTRLQNVRERILSRRDEAALRKNQNGNRANELQQRLATYQDRLGSDPDAVLSELGVTPVNEGDANGYKIGSEVSQGQLRQSGLQQGDIILSVNGHAIGNVTNDRNLINQVVAAKRARVEVQRGARKFFITIPIPD